MMVVKTVLSYPEVRMSNVEGPYTIAELTAVPVDMLFAHLAYSAVSERRRQQILYPRVTSKLLVKTVTEG